MAGPEPSPYWRAPIHWNKLRRRAIRFVRQRMHGNIAQKHEDELSFWSDYVASHGAEPESGYYEKFMLAMGGVKDKSFFDEKLCLDIGCGPKGSLTWLPAKAKAAIGLDPLVESYRPFGIERHSMVYLLAHSEYIPFPNEYVDVVFSMNSLDHVDDLYRACAEIRRVLKPGGYFIGSLNLNEPPTSCEPWTLTEALLAKQLFAGWCPEFYEVRPKIDSDVAFGPYRYFFEPCPEDLLKKSGPQALWCRFRKP